MGKTRPKTRLKKILCIILRTCCELCVYNREKSNGMVNDEYTKQLAKKMSIVDSKLIPEAFSLLEMECKDKGGSKEEWLEILNSDKVDNVAVWFTNVGLSLFKDIIGNKKELW